MTNEQINIAIAEACRWKRVEGEECFFYNGTEQVYIENIPEYFNDLNAMHEAEKTLSHKQKRTYCEKLFNLPTSELESNTFATALQKAEAFLKTIGKWEE